ARRAVPLATPRPQPRPGGGQPARRSRWFRWCRSFLSCSISQGEEESPDRGVVVVGTLQHAGEEKPEDKLDTELGGYLYRRNTAGDASFRGAHEIFQSTGWQTKLAGELGARHFPAVGTLDAMDVPRILRLLLIRLPFNIIDEIA